MGEPELDRALELLSSSVLAERCLGVDLLATDPGARATEILVSLLEETSWYLRERAVEALASRSDALELILEVLRRGPWFARASACDVLGRREGKEAIVAILEQVADRNVSLQRSAVAALRRIGESAGSTSVAERMAVLPPEHRARVLARIGHQEPTFAVVLDRALAGIPLERFAKDEAQTRRSAEVDLHEELALVRLRALIAGAAHRDPT